MRAEKVIIKQPVGFRRSVRHGCECLWGPLQVLRLLIDKPYLSAF